VKGATSCCRSTVAAHRLWDRELGEGYSGIAASQNRLYTMYREGDREVVIALDAGTGKTIWEYRYEAPLTGFNKDGGPGPHTMPPGFKVVTLHRDSI
jgi:outer membrane protein assembly factor BamB